MRKHHPLSSLPASQRTTTYPAQSHYGGSTLGVYPLVTALLVMICIMLAMVSISLQAYRLQQQASEAHLNAELEFIRDMRLYVAGNLRTNHRHALSAGVQIFTPQKAVPNHITEHLAKDSSVLLSPSALIAMGGQPVSNVVLVKVIPEVQPLTFIALEVPKNQLTKTLVYTGIYLTLALFIILLVYTLLLKARMARQLRYISNTATAIMEGKLDKRIPVNYGVNDAYADLALTLNAMLDKNTQLMQDLRQVNNNIAHDLRSPLNRMRSRMEVALLKSRDSEAYQQALSRSIDDVDDLLKTFQALLLMGNLDANARNYQLQPESLSEMLMRLADLYEAVAEDKQQTFESHIAPDIEVLANANLLTQAISNLLENAIKYTQAGGYIQLLLQKQDSMALIVISDNGPGIPAAQRQLVFERFTRLDSARQTAGTGLGMSLVRSILKVHNANVQLLDNNSGLRVEIRLRCQ